MTPTLHATRVDRSGISDAEVVLRFKQELAGTAGAPRPHLLIRTIPSQIIKMPKAYLIDEDIGLDKLASKLQSSVPKPTPKDNEVLIEVHSAAANFFDVLQVAGK